jgi:hypothetical protein
MWRQRGGLLRLRFDWRSRYPSMVHPLERDLPEVLHFFVFPRHLVAEAAHHNVESVDRIIYAIFSRFNQDWKNRTLELFTQAA